MGYIGIDLYPRHFSMAVLGQDNSIIFEQTLPTSSRNLKAAVSTLAGRKSVVFEQSTLATWAFRVLQSCADRVVVADPLHSHWIAGNEKSNDVTAARKLAQLLRAGGARLQVQMLRETIDHLSAQKQRLRQQIGRQARGVSAIRMGDNQYARQYRRLLTKGTKPENARLTVARAIVSTLYAMWRAGTAYQART